MNPTLVYLATRFFILFKLQMRCGVRDKAMNPLQLAFPSEPDQRGCTCLRSAITMKFRATLQTYDSGTKSSVAVPGWKWPQKESYTGTQVLGTHFTYSNLHFSSNVIFPYHLIGRMILISSFHFQRKNNFLDFVILLKNPIINMDWNLFYRVSMAMKS